MVNIKKTNLSLHQERDPDLVNAELAMKRAALKARDVARVTGTAVIVMEGEIIREERLSKPH